MIVVAAFSPSLDTAYVVDDLVLGHPHRPSLVRRVAGGKALNMARAASSLGAEVTAVPVLGGRIGDLVAELLRADGVDAVPVPDDVATRVCVSIGSDSTGDLTEVYEHAVPVSDVVVDAVLDSLRAALVPGAWLSVSGSMPPDAGDDLVTRLADLARASSSRFALDTHGEPLRRLLAAGTAIDLLKINREEARVALGAPADAALGSLVDALRVRTRGAVVVTDGAAGSLAADDTGRWSVALPTTAGHHPVGSGDSFLGALVAGLDDGRPLEQALAAATGAGAANAEVPGAAVFDAHRAREIADLVRVEAV
ncbi:1-phosphofructokinase family hexose kinase [Frigoribacterium sp. PhB24]|uniref:1-phosphofructokinase family hexose kinase n=1 Tax=Frigoribacterium sp. PhB24 TaxID=2485204 RepID=UPI000F9FA493|nr:PfkB family carbohydrate kinase [Frigoribacterium sp. PhB24]ROS52672.1 1-phosphofructokinase/tagatose 6-phosphate kinase/6-phosphofructokinase 2 [Frigoribacterium sp. PhB24]